MSSSGKNFGYDLTTHHLLLLKEPPVALLTLRSELCLPHNYDITEAAMQESTFEGALATIAEKLDIALDGIYEPVALFEVLVSALKKRGSFKHTPHLRDSRLVQAEIEESADGITLVEVPENSGAIIAGSVNSSGQSADYLAGEQVAKKVCEGSGEEGEELTKPH